MLTQMHSPVLTPPLCAATLAIPHFSTTELSSAQQADSCISKVLQAPSQSDQPPQVSEWWQHPLRRYRQLWAVDILEVPVSSDNNHYLLVVQEYFTKWADAIPLIDQTAARITGELIKLFSIYGKPQVLHSDQGRNFESSILAQTLEALGVSKSRTTAYHPQDDGMVERFNRTLLQLLRSYVEKQSDWEHYLPLVLYAYRTSIHSSTGSSPFMLMYGRLPILTPFSQSPAFDAVTYPTHLRAKMAELKDLFDINLAAAASHQKASYDQHTSSPNFSVGDSVWLSVPTAGKLDPRWEGKWRIKAIKSPVNMDISDGTHTKVVHTNRLQHRNLPSFCDRLETETHKNAPYDDTQQSWNPPTVDHVYIHRLLQFQRDATPNGHDACLTG